MSLSPPTPPHSPLMILCSCNVLTVARLLETGRALARQDPSRPVTPGRVLRAMGVRPRCGTCLTLIQRILREAGFPMTCPEPLASVAETLEIVSVELLIVEEQV